MMTCLRSKHVLHTEWRRLYNCNQTNQLFQTNLTLMSLIRRPTSCQGRVILTRTLIRTTSYITQHSRWLTLQLSLTILMTWAPPPLTIAPFQPLVRILHGREGSSVLYQPQYPTAEHYRPTLYHPFLCELRDEGNA